MSTDESASLLTSAVDSLNAVYDQLRELSKQKPAEQQTPGTDRNASTAKEVLTKEDRQELGLFAEEVDDIVRRVTALQVRLGRPK